MLTFENQPFQGRENIVEKLKVTAQCAVRDADGINGPGTESAIPESTASG